MTTEQAFKLFPKATEVYTVGGEVFLSETEASDYAKHFKLGKHEKHVRPEGADKAKGNKAQSAKAVVADTTNTEGSGEGDGAGETQD